MSLVRSGGKKRGGFVRFVSKADRSSICSLAICQELYSLPDSEVRVSCITVFHLQQLLCWLEFLL